MARTQVKTQNIEDQSINVDDIDTTTPNKALITKIIAGTNVELISTGADQGTGEVTINVSGQVLTAKKSTTSSTNSSSWFNYLNNNHDFQYASNYKITCSFNAFSWWCSCDIQLVINGVATFTLFSGSLQNDKDSVFIDIINIPTTGLRNVKLRVRSNDSNTIELRRAVIVMEKL